MVIFPFLLFAKEKAKESLGKKAVKFETSLSQCLLLNAVTKYGEPVQNPKLNRYVNLVGNAIVKNTETKQESFSFVIIKSPEIFSFGTPSGIVVVSSALLRLLKNESGLACVLAREIALVIKKSGLKSIDRKAFVDVSTKKSKKAKRKANRKNYNSIISQLETSLFEKGFGVKKELSADKAGMRFAYIAGYNPNGLTDFLKSLKKKRNAKGKWLTAIPLDQRIKKARGFSGKYKDIEGIETSQPRFNKFAGMLSPKK